MLVLRRHYLIQNILDSWKLKISMFVYFPIKLLKFIKFRGILVYIYFLRLTATRHFSDSDDSRTRAVSSPIIFISDIEFLKVVFLD